MSSLKYKQKISEPVILRHLEVKKKGRFIPRNGAAVMKTFRHGEPRRMHYLEERRVEYSDCYAKNTPRDDASCCRAIACDYDRVITAPTVRFTGPGTDSFRSPVRGIFC